MHIKKLKEDAVNDEYINTLEEEQEVIEKLLSLYAGFQPVTPTIKLNIDTSDLKIDDDLNLEDLVDYGSFTPEEAQMEAREQYLDSLKTSFDKERDIADEYRILAAISDREYQEELSRIAKEEARSYDQLINQVECYGKNDVHASIGIEMELGNRGVEIHREIAFN